MKNINRIKNILSILRSMGAKRNYGGAGRNSRKQILSLGLEPRKSRGLS